MIQELKIKQNYSSIKKSIPSKIVFFLFTIILSASSFSQSNDGTTVTGTVTDSTGELIPGVNILLIGTNKGTYTDLDGAFMIEISENYSKLSVSYLGYKTQIVDAKNKKSINIVIEAEENSLDEIVVVGYGAQSKRNVTGAISKIDMKDTENLPNINITQALRGRVAGVQFTDNGRPGQGGDILVRGAGSLSASNSPLIILDGIFFNGGLAEINPDDIASMEILKDASASAIYGSKAANGVILITSKKGTTIKPRINISAFSGISDYSFTPRLLSPDRYIEKSKEIRRQEGIDFDPNDINTFLTQTEAENFRNGNIIDPYGDISQQGRIASLSASLSGRSEYINYYISGSYSNENGLIDNDNFDRLAFKLNLEAKINDWLKIGTNTLFSETDESGLAANVSFIERQSPFGTWFREDGTPTQFTVPEDPGISRNPLRASFLRSEEDVKNNLFANFYTIIDIPKVEGLTFRVNYSNNYRWIREYQANAQDIYLNTNTTSASKRNWKASDWVVENILNYKTKIGDDHSIDLTLLYGSNKNQIESTIASAEQLQSDLLGWNNLELGTIFLSESNAQEVSGTSSMARLNYTYKNKYLATLTTRRDGSSVFAANNKFATFPSAALTWIASEETFIKKIKFIDFLKFRTSYGAVGNQAISPYQSLSLSGTTNYVFGDGGNSSLGIFPSNIANPDLKWETTYMTNIGIDFSILNKRIDGSINLYDNSTRDLLVRRSIPVATGYTSIWTNLGEVNNRGIEVSLSSTNIQTDKFTWNTNIVFSHNRNRIVSLYGADLNGDGKEDDDIGNSWFIGQPISTFYDFVFDGIYQTDDTDIPSGSQPGFVRFRDLNGDGDTEDAQNDRGFVGQGDPRYNWGVTNTFRYGNLELSVFVNAMQGWEGRFNELDPTHTGDPLRPVNMYDAGWWTEENRSNTRPSLSYNRSTVGHSWYVSRDFIRIQDVSLAYTMPKSILEKLKMSNMSLFVSGKNLATFTDWLGPNPEAASTSFPLARSYNVGLKLGF